MTGTGAPARSTVGARAGTWCAEPELWMDVAVSVSVELIIHSIDRYLSPRPRPEVRSPPLLPRPRQNNVPSSLQAMDGSREYELSVRQQPKQARMCGVGGIFPSPFSSTTHPPSPTTADRRPIDPPPIVQLRVIDKRKNLPSPSPSPPPQQHHQQPSHPHAHTHESSGPLDTSMLTPAGFGTGPFRQNPYYFMFASLAKPDEDTELHWMKVRSRASFPGLVASPTHSFTF